MEGFNDTLQEPVCIDEEVFFGPITEKERKIREQFENTPQVSEFSVDKVNINETDYSKNDSIYKSFSVDTSKYDSFEDSLDEDRHHGMKHITVRKSCDRMKRNLAFYDSLEDVCSLVSNMDRCSISCDKDANNIERHYVVEDSLKISSLPVDNKSPLVKEINFDEDSLAIVDMENSFDDSLEEFNVLQVEDIYTSSDISLQNFNTDAKSKTVCITRNLFETSVEVMHERSSLSVVDKESLDIKSSQLYDSLSSSECKDALKDSLEECQEVCHKLGETEISVNNNMLKTSFDNSVQILYEKNVNSNNLPKNCEPYSSNVFDSSVQILCEKNVSSVSILPEISEASPNNCFDVLPETFNENNANSVNLTTDLKISTQNNCDKSVQILYEKSADSPNNVVANEKKYNSTAFAESCDTLHDTLEVTKNFNGTEKQIFLNRKNADEHKLCESEKQNTNISMICTGSNVRDERSSDSSSVDDFFDCVGNFDSSKNILVEKYSDSTSHISVSEVNVSVEESKKIFSGKHLDDESVLSLNLDETVHAAVSSNSSELDPLGTCDLKLLKDKSNLKLHVEFKLNGKQWGKDFKIKPKNFQESVFNKSSTETLSKAALPNYETDASDSSNNKLNTGSPSKTDSFDCKKNLSNSRNNKYVTNSIDPKPKNNILAASCLTKISDGFSNKITSNEVTSKALSLDFKPFEMEKRTKHDAKLLQALDLHDTSSFLNESVLQSKDSILPLNLCLRDSPSCNNNILYRSESKENIPYCVPLFEEASKSTKKCVTNTTPSKTSSNSTTPKNFKNSSSKGNSCKKASATKIPIRKVDNFVIPTSLQKSNKISPSSTGKSKCTQMCNANGSDKKGNSATTTPNKTPHHYCKVRNSVFSKVPQIMSKKFPNIESPVAQYIKNCSSTKTTPLVPVLLDCMNNEFCCQHMESPYQQHIHKSTNIKTSSRK